MHRSIIRSLAITILILVLGTGLGLGLDLSKGVLGASTAKGKGSLIGFLGKGLVETCWTVLNWDLALTGRWGSVS